MTAAIRVANRPGLSLYGAMDFLAKYDRLCKKFDLTSEEACRRVRIAPKLISNWRNYHDALRAGTKRRKGDRGGPTLSQAIRLARLFHVTADYLGDDAVDEYRPVLLPDEEHVLTVYRSLRNRDQLTAEEAIYRLIRYVAGPEPSVSRTPADRPSAPGRPPTDRTGT